MELLNDNKLFLLDIIAFAKNNPQISAEFNENLVSSFYHLLDLIGSKLDLIGFEASGETAPNTAALISVLSSQISGILSNPSLIPFETSHEILFSIYQLVETFIIDWVHGVTDSDQVYQPVNNEHWALHLGDEWCDLVFKHLISTSTSKHICVYARTVTPLIITIQKTFEKSVLPYLGYTLKYVAVPTLPDGRFDFGKFYDLHHAKDCLTIVILKAGKYFCDDFELMGDYDAWVHVDGPILSQYVPKTESIPFHSMTIDFGDWFGIPFLSPLTLLRTSFTTPSLANSSIPTTAEHISSITSINLQKIVIHSLFISSGLIQSYVNRVTECTKYVEYCKENLGGVDGVEVFGDVKWCFVVRFSGGPEDAKVLGNIYDNLGDELKTELELEFVEYQGFWWIRYCPFYIDPSKNQANFLPQYISSLASEFARYKSIFRFREEFKARCKKVTELEYIETQSGDEDIWVGLGNVRYTPVIFSKFGNENKRSNNSKIERCIDYLNQKIGQELEKEYGHRLFTKGVINLGQQSTNDVLESSESSRRESLYDESVNRPSQSSSPSTQQHWDGTGSIVFGVAGEISRRVSLVLGRGSELLEDGAEEENRSECVYVKVGVAKQEYTLDRIMQVIDIIVQKGVKLERDEYFMSQMEVIIRKGIKQAERELQMSESATD
ncbi:hypothetical protein HK098_007537, partial [Nowakowskiella sp. JEL0407]